MVQKKNSRDIEDIAHDIQTDAKLIGQNIKHAAEKAARPFKDLMTPPSNEEQMIRAIVDVWHVASTQMRGNMKPIKDFVDDNLDRLKQQPILGPDSLRQHLEVFSRDMSERIVNDPKWKDNSKTTLGLVSDLFKHCIEAVKVGGKEAWNAFIGAAEKLLGHSHEQSRHKSATTQHYR